MGLLDGSATLASCKADVHNLAGFVSRSRPVPQYAHALAYYDAEGGRRLGGLWLAGAKVKVEF